MLYLLLLKLYKKAVIKTWMVLMGFDHLINLILICLRNLGMREFKNRLVKKTTTMTVFCMDAVVNLLVVR